MVALPAESAIRLQRARQSTHRIGTLLQQSGYWATTASGMLLLLAAVLYMHGAMPTLFSNPMLSGLIFASATVALLLETSGKALAPRELSRAEAVALKLTSRLRRKPGKHLSTDA